MESGDERVRVKLDVKTGELEVDSPASQYGEVVRQVSALIPALRQAHVDAKGEERGSSEVHEETDATKRKPKSPKSTRPNNGSGRGSLGATRYDDFQPIKLGIDDKAELELKGFYETKKPKGQEEQVAVIIYKLSKLLGKERLNYDQIYQGFRIAGEAHPPRSMAGVVSNMGTKMLAERETDGVRLKIQGVDLVEKQLPRKSEK